MTIVDLLVSAGAVLSSAVLLWFFFGTKRVTQRAQVTDESQQVTVVVRGGYTPALIEAVAGIPLRIIFDRRESGDCSSRVVFPDLGITRSLPANTKTEIDLLPDRVGEFAFSCAMNMIHGTLTVAPPARQTDTPHPGTTAITAPTPSETAPVPSPDRVPDPAAEEAAEASARRVEVRELTYRVAAGSVLTIPVLFAVMLHELFGATWIPALMLNHWWELALISPVMFVVGAPIHRTGWLALRHRAPACQGELRPAARSKSAPAGRDSG